jgi:hypothetical protein
MITKKSGEAPDAGEQNGQIPTNSFQPSQINQNGSIGPLVLDVKELALDTPSITAAIMKYIRTGKKSAINKVIREFACMLNKICPGTWAKLVDEMVLLECPPLVKRAITNNPSSKEDKKSPPFMYPQRRNSLAIVVVDADGSLSSA